MECHDILSKNTKVDKKLIDTYLERYWEIRGTPEKNFPYYKRFQERIAALDLVRYVYSNSDINASYIREGWVYIVTNSAFPNCVKIGKAIDMDNRLKNMQTYDPFRQYICEHQFFVEDRHSTEIKIHSLLADRRLSGEWFDGTPEEIRNIISGIV